MVTKHQKVFGVWLDLCHEVMTKRKVLTNRELRAAYADGEDAQACARRNDDLADEYDAILAAEEEEEEAS